MSHGERNAHFRERVFFWDESAPRCLCKAPFTVRALEIANKELFPDIKGTLKLCVIDKNTYCSKGVRNEKNVSTQQNQKKKNAWFQNENADCQWTRGYQKTPPERKKSAGTDHSAEINGF